MVHVISIDTEYHTDPITGCIDKVFCICARNGQNTYQRWMDDSECRHYPDALDDVVKGLHLDDEKCIFLCHAFDKAERQAFEFLGCAVENYNWVCTYHLARMLRFSCTPDALVKELKDFNLSYASLCSQYELALIDTSHKEAMRRLCIEDKTMLMEKSIMDYCLEDTEFLAPLFKALFQRYYDQLRGAFCPIKNDRAFKDISKEDAIDLLVKQTKDYVYFGKIAQNGLPLSPERVEKVKENALAYREKFKCDFTKKYPLSFVYQIQTGTLKARTSKIQDYLSQQIETLHIENYPRTKNGSLSTDSSVLKDYFKGTEGFGEDFRQLKKMVQVLNSSCKTKENPFDCYYDGHLHYETLNPYGSKTGRCQPSTKRFLFGWHKSMYGLLDPTTSQNKCLCEVDFSSQETFLQAVICRDDRLMQIYQSKDIYLKFGVMMGLIPAQDFDTMSVSDLKSKYATTRQQIKAIVLGLSYGMGEQNLARRANIPLQKARHFVRVITQKVLHASTVWKERLKRMAKNHHITALATPDGFICGIGPKPNLLTVGNWSFQSAGAYILRNLVRNLWHNRDKANFKLLATIHDAVFFSADDEATCELIRKQLIAIANKSLGVTNASIKAGTPDIIESGEIWTPDGVFTEQFLDLINFDPASLHSEDLESLSGSAQLKVQYTDEYLVDPEEFFKNDTYNYLM